jgi:hypothetical protein
MAPRVRCGVCDHRAVPIRRVILALAALAVAVPVGCGGDPATTPDALPSSAGPSSPTGVAPTPTGVAVSPTTIPPPPTLPSGLASPFGEDLAAGDVPLTDLVPAGTDPVGSWFATTSSGEAIVVAWEAPGSDTFRTDRGVVVWRHTGEPVALWRPVFAATYPAARHPVLGITAVIDDVTGDGSQDALVFAETGGSGACGTYLVIDPAAGSQVFRRAVCDATIQPSADPVGLTLTEAVYAHGDPHCCPSATRTTILRRNADGGWTTISETTTPT